MTTGNSTSIGVERREDFSCLLPFSNYPNCNFKIPTEGAQSIKHLTLGFSSGHDLIGPGIEPYTGLHAQRGVCLKDSLPLPLPQCACSLSFKQINVFLKK